MQRGVRIGRFAQFFSVKYFARSFTVKPVDNYYNSCKKSPCSSLAPTAIIQRQHTQLIFSTASTLIRETFSIFIYWYIFHI